MTKAQTVKQSDEVCGNCGLPLPGENLAGICCPCGALYVRAHSGARWGDFDTIVADRRTVPHECKWLGPDDCDCEECQSNLWAAPAPPGDQVDPDVLGYLHERYGVQPTFRSHRGGSSEYAVQVGVLEMQFWQFDDKECWSWFVDHLNGSEACTDRAVTLAAACDAADEAVRALLDETREELE